MGILNVTPDSFSDGGDFYSPEAALNRARQIASEGADILDIGAESTRPGSQPVDPTEEWRRLEPVLAGLCDAYPLPISIDTRHAETARLALESGAVIINDVSCGRNSDLLKPVAEFRAGYVLMHSRGEPATMMTLAKYQDVASEVVAELRTGLDQALQLGLSLEQICLDPGFGFAKTPEQNWEVMEKLGSLSALGRPILVGLSRKRMLRELTGEAPAAILGAGLAAAARALQRGARILRVHEVAATRGFLQTLQKSGFPID